MAEASLSVDLLNPGQVFACLGLVEAADTLLGEAEGTFDWSDEPDVRFWLRAAGDVPPIEHVIEFLSRAEAIGEAPEGSPNHARWNPKWGTLRSIPRSSGYPYPDPDSAATVVCRLIDGTRTLTLDHWGDATRRDNVKFWGGAGGYPGVALARDALALVRDPAAVLAAGPFAFGRPQQSSFRLDWRRDYIPIDAGFSLNKHDEIVTLGFPVVELLGALGLSHARPLWLKMLEYRYGIIGNDDRRSLTWFPPALLRAALGTCALPFPTRSFCMRLGWPGKAGQARSITTVTEQNPTWTR